MIARIWQKGRPSAFKKPMGSPLKPGAFQGLMLRRMFKILLAVTPYSKGKGGLEAPGGLFSKSGLGVTVGKNLTARIRAFAAYVVSNGRPSPRRREGILGASGGA